MRRSHRSRPSAAAGPRRQILAVVAALTVFGSLVAVTQISSAESNRAAPACEPTSPPGSVGASAPGGASGNGNTTGDGARSGQTSPSAPTAKCDEREDRDEAGGATGGVAPGGGLDTLGENCDNSRLPAHTGFQDGDRCVSTSFGEVGAAEQNPTLLITEAPRRVRAGQPFQIVVSTRNLVRDRFLPAGQGGYYLETSLLNDEGLVRGHFHTACRVLSSSTAAVDPAPVPAFFVATEDLRGGAEPDSVIISVPGLPAGLAQCSAWAGDGSHRIPMMQRANQIPALDSVRIQVQPGDEKPPADGPEPEEPPAGNPGSEQPPAGQPCDNSPGQEPGQEEQPGNGQGTDEQAPGPEKSGAGNTSPAPVATESAPDRSVTTDTTQAPPARDINARGSGGGLALTGSNAIGYLVVGAALLIAGMALLHLTRRRRRVRR